MPREKLSIEETVGTDTVEINREDLPLEITLEGDILLNTIEIKREVLMAIDAL